MPICDIIWSQSRNERQTADSLPERQTGSQADGYKAQFNKDNYDIIRFQVPKGKREDIKKCADKLGISMSELVVRALEKQYLLDLSKD